MQQRNNSFHSVVASLWFRLAGIAIVSFVFLESLYLAQGTAQGWTYYLSPPEVAFEVALRLAAVALAGIALGTIVTAAVAPFLRHFHSSRERFADRVTKVAVVLAVYLDSGFALKVLIKWSNLLAGWPVTVLLWVYFLAYVVALCIPRGRQELATSLDGVLGERMTRLTVIGTVLGTAALVVTEFAFGHSAPTVRAGLAPQRPKSNILLITFDALSAEDMSLYGYRLPTTPNIDAFAREGTVFTNFFSAATFTTPALATILTGRPPSESRVFQLQGHVRSSNGGKSLPHLMRVAGYTTAAAISSPYAYYFAESLEDGYDSLPEPAFHKGGLAYLWDATRPLHQRSRLGIRIQEYLDLESAWDFVPVLLGRSTPDASQEVRPTTSFQLARETLAKLPDGFFLWVHVMAPHNPYLPDLADRGRFLPFNEMRTQEEQSAFPLPFYRPDQQTRMDKVRLRYDEYVASADRAFGSFMSDLESGGKLRNTTVIVSADHGESFEAGVRNHGGPYQTRPVIHIPLIIRTPDQQQGRRVPFVADQTALAPTILDLAGQSKPEWMPGRSLAGWLNGDGQGTGEGLAFTEYFERNSVFAPLWQGTVGVIDGRYQYILDLVSQKGLLRPLNEAQIPYLDRSEENPGLARALRAAIYSRFPDLPRNPR